MQLNGVVPIPAKLRAQYVGLGLWDNAPLRDGLEAAAERAPDRVAIVDRESSWTYEQLERSVARGVARLARDGVCPGAAVLVIAPLIASAFLGYLDAQHNRGLSRRTGGTTQATLRGSRTAA